MRFFKNFIIIIFTDVVMHNYRSNQSAFMTRFGTDLRHQYGIFGGKSQTSFSRNATQAGSEEGRLFSQASTVLGQAFDVSHYQMDSTLPLKFFCKTSWLLENKQLKLHLR